MKRNSFYDNWRQLDRQLLDYFFETKIRLYEPTKIIKIKDKFCFFAHKNTARCIGERKTKHYA